MALMSDLVSQVRAMVSGQQADRLTILSEDWLVGGSTISVAYPVEGLGVGSVLSAGLMTFQVAVQPRSAGGPFTVIANPGGEPVMPVPSGSVVRVSPRHTDRSIFDHLNTQVLAMGSPSNGLWSVRHWTADVNMVNDMYPFPVGAEDVTGVLSVLHRPVGDTENWVNLDRYTVQRPGGQPVVFVHEHVAWGTLAFTGKAPFKPAAHLTDDPVGVCGLSASMLDIPVLGAAGMLLMSDEGRRVSPKVQGDPRRANELPPTSATAAARDLLRQRDQRIDAEASRLTASNGARLRG